MAWQPTFNDVAYTLVVKKTTAGAPEASYPKTYNLLDAFGGHQSITATEWAQLGDSLRIQRLNDFRAYVSETEGVDVTPTITNNDHRRGASLLASGTGWVRGADGLIVPFDSSNTGVDAFYDKWGSLTVNGTNMPFSSVVEVAFDVSYQSAASPNESGFLRHFTNLRFANISPILGGSGIPQECLRSALLLERICFRSKTGAPFTMVVGGLCSNCPNLKIVDIGTLDWSQTQVSTTPYENFTSNRDGTPTPIAPGIILGPSHEAIAIFKTKFPMLEAWDEGLVDYDSLT